MGLLPGVAMKGINEVTPPDESERLKVLHVFECNGCHLYWLGQELKKVDGKRSCKRCLSSVQDVTFTENAQIWLAYHHLTSIERK